MRLISLSLPLLLAGLVACSGEDEPTGDTDPVDTAVTCDVDVDGDGACADVDCDDTDPNAYPGAREIPYNGKDEDCDGNDITDFDEDGFDAIRAGGTDCNDANPEIYPGAPEVCYGDLDMNCDEYIPTDDCDQDGYGRRADCDDENPDVNPDATEIWYDGVDSDCKYDSDFDQDGDGDEITWDPSWPLDSWPDDVIVWNNDEVGKFKFVPKDELQDYWSGLDCNDLDQTVGGNLKEKWDGVDRNCDDLIDWLHDRDDTANWIGNAGVSDAAVGSSIALVGDLDGSGTVDVAFADTYGGPTNQGGVYIIDAAEDSGKAFEAAFVAITDPDPRGVINGFDMVTVDDLNGDGKPELVVGGPYLDGPTGAAMVFDGAKLGRGGGSEDGTQIVGGALAYLTPGEAAGGVVANLGDLNGDGIGEIGTHGSYWALFDGRTGGLNLGIFDGARVGEGGSLGIGQSQSIISDTEEVGGSLAGGTDIDGDGTIDVILTTNAITFTETAAVNCAPRTGGAAYLLGGGDVTGGVIRGLADFESITGPACLGFTVGTLDDVDGDGYGEIVLAEPGAPNSFDDPNSGVVYIIDGDDWAADGVAADLAFTTITTDDAGANLRVEQSSADHDGDGILDLMVGAPGGLDTIHAKLSWMPPTGEGSVYAFNGTQIATGGALSTDDATARLYHRTSGTLFGAGWAVGDMDGDGGPDIAIGAPAQGVGTVYIYTSRLGIFAEM